MFEHNYSHLHDLMNCSRHFNVSIMKLYISGLDLARKLKFSIYVHLPPINKMLEYCHAWVILCSVGEINILEHWNYISDLDKGGGKGSMSQV